GGRGYGVSFSPDNRLLAAVMTGGVQWWRIGDYESRQSLPEGAGPAKALACSADSQVIATAHEDGSIKFWAAADATLLGAHKGHAGPVMAIAFAPDGRTAATAGSDGTIRIWPVPGP